ncbi:MAG: hypothetical protein HFG45_09780 [Oscillospiraceae bacterium]|jgi:hypothetical protein|nr:hypothetical protein [Oscillospiraceae bacterium]
MKCERCKQDNPEFSERCGFCGRYIAQYPMKVIWGHLEKASPDALCVYKHCGVEAQPEWTYCNSCGCKWNVPPKSIKYYWFDHRFCAKLEDGIFWFRRDQEKHVWIQISYLWDTFFDAATDVQPMNYGYDEEAERSAFGYDERPKNLSIHD